MADRKTLWLLDEAVIRGIISDQQRAQIEALEHDTRHDNEERLKPIGTFNEIFVTIGIAMVIAAASGLLAFMNIGGLAVSLSSAIICLFTAYYFDRHKRFRLPIIYACLNAAFYMAIAVSIGMYDTAENIFKSQHIAPMLAALVVLAACAWRFKVPFLMLPITVLFTVIVTLSAKQVANDTPYRLLLGGSGLSILAIAVYFDLRDPERISRWSDFAFWSYVAGSPLFVHSLFISLFVQEKHIWNISTGLWLLVTLLAIIVSFVGLLLNRRALILSTLIYVGVIIFRLLSTLTVGKEAEIILITLLLIGFYITSLGSRWAAVRRFVISRLPAWRWLRYLPPVA